MTSPSALSPGVGSLVLRLREQRLDSTAAGEVSVCTRAAASPSKGTVREMAFIGADGEQVVMVIVGSLPMNRCWGILFFSFVLSRAKLRGKINYIDQPFSIFISCLFLSTGITNQTSGLRAEDGTLGSESKRQTLLLASWHGACGSMAHGSTADSKCCEIALATNTVVHTSGDCFTLLSIFLYLSRFK